MREPRSTGPLEPGKPPFTCTHGSSCNEPAVAHVLFRTLMSGFACVEHKKLLGTEIAYLDIHDYDPMCSMDGAKWKFGNPSRCEIDFDDLPVLAEEKELTDSLVGV